MGCYQSKKKISLSVERMLCNKLVSLLNVNLISCLFLSTGSKEKQVSEAEIFDASWNGEPTCKGTAITFYPLLTEFTEKENIDVYGLLSPKRCRKWISTVIIQDLNMMLMTQCTASDGRFRVLAFVHILFWNGVRECQSFECNVVSCYFWPEQRCNPTMYHTQFAAFWWIYDVFL